MADTYRLPTEQGDTPPYEYQVELDGTVYTLGFRYQERTQRWLYHVSTAEGVAIVQGQAVLNAYPLLQRFKDVSMPAGEIRAVATSEPAREADLDELGTRVLLVYLAATAAVA